MYVTLCVGVLRLCLCKYDSLPLSVSLPLPSSLSPHPLRSPSPSPLLPSPSPLSPLTLTTDVKPSPTFTGSMAARDSCHYSFLTSDTESDDESDYEYMEGSNVTSPVTPHCQEQQPLYPGSTTQPLAVPYECQKNQKISRAASLRNSPVTPARRGDSHQLPCLDRQKLRSMQDRGIDG